MGAIKLPNPQHMPDMSQQKVGKIGVAKKSKSKDRSHLKLIQHDSTQEDLRENPPAGFFIRFLAAVVDGIALGLLNKGGVMIIGMSLGPVLGGDQITMGAVGLVFGLLASIGYYVIPTAKYGATLGKKVFKLRVINSMTGEKVSMNKAAGRELVGKFISSIILMIGYLIAPFTHQKKALHDMMFQTRVVQEK